MVMPEKPRLTLEEAIDALNTRGASTECPVCGGVRWGPVGALGNLLITLPAITPDGEVVQTSDQLGGINAFALTCKTCGFIRLHAEQVLAEE
jgi:hypothetical protein